MTPSRTQNRPLATLVLLAAVTGLLSAGMAAADEPPRVTLADTYDGNVDLAEYWVSEKYDGVRGYWDGEHLLTLCPCRWIES